MLDANTPEASGVQRDAKIVPLDTSTSIASASHAVNILNRLGNVRRASRGWIAHCPAHDDRHPSLSIWVGRNGWVCLKCWAGCPREVVLAALALQLRDLRPPAFAESGRKPAKMRRNLAVLSAAAPDPDWANVAQACLAQVTVAQLRELAAELGVTSHSLQLLSAGWHSEKRAFTIPERDGQRRACGISLRWLGGRKGFIRGGRRGLIIPSDLDDRSGRVYVVEGASDLAALLDHGLAAVGRFSAFGGVAQLADLLRGRELLVVGERDAKPDGTWPGRDGAIAVASKLQHLWGRTVKYALPPEGAKDIRDWLTEGGRRG